MSIAINHVVIISKPSCKGFVILMSLWRLYMAIKDNQVVLTKQMARCPPDCRQKRPRMCHKNLLFKTRSQTVVTLPLNHRASWRKQLQPFLWYLFFWKLEKSPLSCLFWHKPDVCFCRIYYWLEQTYLNCIYFSGTKIRAAGFTRARYTSDLGTWGTLCKLMWCFPERERYREGRGFRSHRAPPFLKMSCKQ